MLGLNRLGLLPRYQAVRFAAIVFFSPHISSTPSHILLDS
jgi:hypothetical protein